MNKTLMLIPLLLLLASCSFSLERLDKKNYGKTFAATKLNIKVLSEKNYILGGLKYIFILDLPFSLITDIVFFPYDLYMAPEYKADRGFWDNHFSSTNTSPPNYSALSKNYSEYGANEILDKLGREYLKQHPDYAIPFIKIAADNKEIERSGEILSTISDDWQIPTETMIDICTLSASNIEKYKSIIIGYIHNRSTPLLCLHSFSQVLPSGALTNNRYQVSLLKTISKRLRESNDPNSLEYSYIAEKKADKLHTSMQIEGTVSSIDFKSKWITIAAINDECIAVKFSKYNLLDVNDNVSGEFKDSGGTEAFNNTKEQSFHIYVPYPGDELESTAKRLCK